MLTFNCFFQGRIRTIPIRLAGSASPYQGRVELLHNGIWGTVCDDNFGDKEADVACHHLGYTKALRYKRAANTYGQGVGAIHMDDLNCTGAESNLQDCKFNGWSIHDCHHGEDVGVVCDTRVACGVKKSLETEKGKLY